MRLICSSVDLNSKRVSTCLVQSGRFVRTIACNPHRLEKSYATFVDVDSMKDIIAGSDVRASYGVVDGEAMAMRLDVTSSPKSGWAEAPKTNDSSSTLAK